MDDLLYYITEALDNQTSLETAVDQTLADYKTRAYSFAGSELSTLKPRSNIDPLLESLMSKCVKDDRYLRVFDILEEREPENINVLESKALMYSFVDEGKTIDALAGAIALLEEKDRQHEDLPDFYLWIGHMYEENGDFNRALAVYALGMSYCHPDGRQWNVHYQLLKTRACLYLTMNKVREAQQDLRLINQLHDKNTKISDLLRDLDKKKEEF